MLPPQPTARMAAATTTAMTKARAAIAMPRHHANGKMMQRRRRRSEPPSTTPSSSSSSSSSVATFSSAPGSSSSNNNLIAANLTSWLVARGAMPPTDKASVVLVTANDDDDDNVADADANTTATVTKRKTSLPPLLATSKKLPRGSPALSVPEAAWIDAAAVDASPLGEATKGLEPWLRLALLLLHARSPEGVASPLAPYASALPSEPDAPVFWSDQELELLAGTQVGDAVAGYRAFFAARHAQLEAGLFSRDRALFPEASFSAPAFAWAAATVRARLFAPLDGGASGSGGSGSGNGGEASSSSSSSSSSSAAAAAVAGGGGGGGDVAIVPGIDLVSHSRSPNASLRVSKGGGVGGVVGGVGGFLGGLRIGGSNNTSGGGSNGGEGAPPSGGRVAVLEVTSDRDLGEGEALTIDFGPGRTDSQVLLDHGAVDPAAPRPGFVLTLALPREPEEEEEEGGREGEGEEGGGEKKAKKTCPRPPPTFFDDKLDIAEGAGYGPTATFVLDPRARSPPQEMLCYLRLMNLGGADAFLLEPVFRGEAWSRHVQEPVSRENERAVCASMASGCAAALARIGGDAAGDERALAGGGDGRQLSRRAAAALRIRCGERAALASAARWFAGREAALDSLEYYQERRLRGLGLLDEEGRSTYDDFFKDGIA